MFIILLSIQFSNLFFNQLSDYKVLTNITVKMRSFLNLFFLISRTNI